MRLASRFGRYNSIRRERPLTDDELMQFVPSVFSGDKHESRSECKMASESIAVWHSNRS